MNYEERVKKLKQSIDQNKEIVFDKLTEEAFQQKLREAILALPDVSFKRLFKRVEKVEEEVNKELTGEQITEILSDAGIHIKNMPEKYELNEMLKGYIPIDRFERFKDEIGGNAEQLTVNIQENDNRVKKLSAKLYELNHQLEQEYKKGENRINSKIKYLKENVSKIRKEIKEKKFEIKDDLDMKGYKITNLAAPTKESDAANKKYTDDAARKAALALQGGGGTHIHIGPNPPSDPKLNALWIQI